MKYEFDIFIIGAGPAGMMAAITAAQNKSLKIGIAEHNDRVGKKILSTGNGKCNLTNMNMQKAFYRSDSDPLGNNKSFYSVVESFSPTALRDFFLEAGMPTRERDGYVYPYSESAATVLDTLRHMLDTANVSLLTEFKTDTIKKNNKGYIIQAGEITVLTRKLILACGSKCAPKTGSDGTGYTLASNLGHTIIKVIPALTQLKCKEKFFKEISGVRSKMELSLYVGEKLLHKEKGELQFTDYGISGIPVFQVSRIVKRALDSKKTPIIYIDLMPEFEALTIEAMLKKQLQASTTDLAGILSGFINKKLAIALTKLAGARPGDTSCTTALIKKLACIIKQFEITPIDTNGFDNAQTCAGGISLKEIDLKTMESLINKDLYFAGEMVDVDGICGGYNLHWAFSSGRLAGINARGEC